MLLSLVIHHGGNGQTFRLSGHTVGNIGDGIYYRLLTHFQHHYHSGLCRPFYTYRRVLHSFLITPFSLKGHYKICANVTTLVQISYCLGQLLPSTETPHLRVMICLYCGINTYGHVRWNACFPQILLCIQILPTHR